jgi:MraZ protein
LSLQVKTLLVSLTLPFFLTKVGKGGEKWREDSLVFKKKKGIGMFRGGTPISLDNKGRLAVPARYRDELISLCAGRLIITADPSKCLLLYPQPVWEPIEQKLNALSSFNAQTRSLQRLLIGNASDVEMDGAGRILVPPPLRQFAGLSKDVVLVGQGSKFELWDDEKWNLQIENALAFKDGIPPELDGFTL